MVKAPADMGSGAFGMPGRCDRAAAAGKEKGTDGQDDPGGGTKAAGRVVTNKLTPKRVSHSSQ